MPFTFKLAQRLARARTLVIVLGAIVAPACEQPVATTTTTAATPVTQVIISPAAVTLDPGAVRQFAAFGRTAAGDSLAVGITWSATGGTITPAGLYTAGATAGAFRVVGSNTQTELADTSTVTVTAPPPPPPPPPPGAWPNEPPGMTLVSEEPFNALVESGWNIVQRQTTNGSGVSIGSDATAPASPANVLTMKYAAGYVAGSEPGAEYLGLGTPASEVFVGFWWKASNPWQFHPSGVNKIAFLFSAVDNIYIMMYNDGSGPPTIQVEPQLLNDVRRLAPNVTATPVTLGVWHRIEWYVKYSTTLTSGDGIVKWWVDGVLQGVYSNLQMPAAAGFVECTIAPTWGGIGGTKTQTDFYWYDQYHVSRR
jgi:hypothetical protein